MAEEYSEQQKWMHFWGSLNGCDKGGSILRSFFMQLYSFDDYGGNRSSSYTLDECTALNIPEINDYDFSRCVFRLQVRSLIPPVDQFRIHIEDTVLNEGELILPERDSRLISAVSAGFSDWSFTNNCFIPESILQKVTLPIEKIRSQLNQEKQKS